MAPSELTAALADGACLIGPAGSDTLTDLKAVLLTRLSNYHARLGPGHNNLDDSSSLKDVQLTTARQALSVVERVQQCIGQSSDSPNEAPSIGTRDLAELRTLLSIVFKWAVEPLLSHLSSSWPSKTNVKTRGGPRVIDITSTPEDYQVLSSIVTSLIALLFPNGVQGLLFQTLITTTILDRHLTDLLRPCIALGWLPRSLSSELTRPMDEIRPQIMRLLAILPPSQTIAALGGILSSSQQLPQHVLKSCSSLLSRQLLRPEGVQGLCAAVFSEGEGSGDDAPLEKIEHITRVLTTVPSNMKPEEYFRIITPRIIGLLSENAPSTYRRAAAFTVSRMLVSDGTFLHQSLTSTIIFSLLHPPFLQVTSESFEVNDTPNSSAAALAHLSPSKSLSTLMTLILNTDPSPDLISSLISPIVSALYSLLHHLDHIKTSDPSLKESLNGLLSTWGRTISISEGINALWAVLFGEGGDWKVGLDGEIRKLAKSDAPSSLDFLTPEDLRKSTESEDFDLDANLLNLYPDPAHFVRFLKTIDRADISSELFVRLLEVYRVRKSQAGSDPMQTLLYLHIIIQMQTNLSNGGTSSNILCKPTHMLSFVHHVLESASAVSREKDSTPEIKQNEDALEKNFRIVPQVDTNRDDISDEGDSDDDTPGSEVISADDEMIETSVNLLLSILEANEDLSARTTPMLNDIFSLLEPLARDGSSSVKQVSREARMVMTARLASTSTPRKSGSRSSSEDNSQETYQNALKLLQDPILPVRAHGLLLLRQLVTPSASRTSKEPKVTDPALVPAILSIFLQSIQDDDSYIFLNAVQGLAAMVDTFGKDVLRGLINEYTVGLDGLGSTDLTQQDVDTRLRVGEALGLVIRRCGSALGAYVDMLVPKLFNIVRSRHIPTTLRTSSLALLAECESTDALALLPYVDDLAEAMIDLLQIESVQQKTATGTPDKDGNDATMDTQPTSANPKFPPLRRAALHFLSLLVGETTKQVYDSSSLTESLFTTSWVKRAKITLTYMSSTDEDAIVRVMARETGEGLDELQQAVLGI